MILHYYKTHPERVSVFVNMDLVPEEEEILAFIYRGLKAGGVSVESVTNLRLNNWSGNTNAFWYADLKDSP